MLATDHSHEANPLRVGVRRRGALALAGAIAAEGAFRAAFRTLFADASNVSFRRIASNVSIISTLMRPARTMDRHGRRRPELSAGIATSRAGRGEAVRIVDRCLSLLRGA